MKLQLITLCTVCTLACQLQTSNALPLSTSIQASNGNGELEQHLQARSVWDLCGLSGCFGSKSRKTSTKFEFPGYGMTQDDFLKFGKVEGERVENHRAGTSERSISRLSTKKEERRPRVKWADEHGGSLTPVHE
ncbi:hypothetical protein CBS101457_003092 [Exobasidium rhododendri]|nr:hypothetical protein CBS101457_003092 [Exobasidium rhododendri]